MVRVLIADSSKEVAQLLAVALRRHGDEVDVYGRSDAPSIVPDVLILDTDLRDAARIASEQRRHRSGLAVLATGVRPLEDGLPPCGAERYLMKPFRLTELVAALEAVSPEFGLGGDPHVRMDDQPL